MRHRPRRGGPTAEGLYTPFPRRSPVLATQLGHDAVGRPRAVALCRAWGPAFAQDLEWALLHALSRLGLADGSIDSDAEILALAEEASSARVGEANEDPAAQPLHHAPATRARAGSGRNAPIIREGHDLSAIQSHGLPRLRANRNGRVRGER